MSHERYLTPEAIKNETIAGAELNAEGFLYEDVRHLAGYFGFSKAHFNPSEAGYDPSTLPDWGYIKELKKFSNETWDFRGGKERWEAVQANMTPEQEAKIMETAERIGMVKETDLEWTDFDAVIVVGGAGFTPKLRAEYAKELIDKYGINPPLLAFLGSPREVTDNERPRTDTYAPRAKTEYDLMRGAAEVVFGVSQKRASEHIAEYEHGKSKIIVLNAPSSEIGRRSNTADTYAFLADQAEFKPGQHALVVTTRIFVRRFSTSTHSGF